VLELGHVVADAPNYTNVQYIAGNMFETVPPASMIFLKVGEIKVESMDGRLGADLLVGRG